MNKTAWNDSNLVYALHLCANKVEANGLIKVANDNGSHVYAFCTTKVDAKRLAKVSNNSIF